MTSQIFPGYRDGRSHQESSRHQGLLGKPLRCPEEMNAKMNAIFKFLGLTKFLSMIMLLL